MPVTVATADDHRFGALTGVQIDPVFRYLRDHLAAARVIRRLHASWVVNGLRFLCDPEAPRFARRHAVVHVQGWERNSLGLIATLALRASGACIVYTAHNTFERHASDLDGARVIGGWPGPRRPHPG